MGYRWMKKTECNYTNVTPVQLEQIKSDREAAIEQRSQLAKKLGVLKAERSRHEDLESQKLRDEISTLETQIEIQETIRSYRE